MTNRTNDPAAVDDLVRSAGNRGRVDFDTQLPAPADAPDEDTVVQPIDLADDELDARLLDRSTRRETLADPGVKIRLARRDPTIAAEIDAWNARALAAEERADAAVAAVASAAPRPRPLPGGSAAPTRPASPGRDALLRTAAAVARGEASVPHNMTGFVEGDGNASATVRGV